jgi:CDP-4-dehydro-6-deoxyglucose reductase
MTHQITIKDSGRRFISNDGESVLDAALRQDIGLPFGCRSGSCGACRARLLQGRINYDENPSGLTELERRQGYVLLCQARAMSPLIIEIEEIPDHRRFRVRNLPARVTRRELLCHDVMALHVQLPKGDAFEYLAGQYVDFLLPEGKRRSFSIANAPGGTERILEFHLRHAPGGHFTDYAFNQMPDRALLRFEGPLGNFYLRDSDRPAIMIGGGTGFAPLKSMLEFAFLRRLSRPIHLYWGVRARRDLYFDRQLKQWQREHPTFRYTPVLSEPAAEDAWSGRTGFVHEAVLADAPALDGHEVYMSGPPAMIQAGRQHFTARGLPMEHLHYDSFDYAHVTWDREAAPT